MKRIFLGEAARDSGNLGFSDACPLWKWSVLRWCHCQSDSCILPSCPHGVNIHSLCNIDDQLDVGIIVVIRAPGNLLNPHG
jgi:hypothetical protein